MQQEVLDKPAPISKRKLRASALVPAYLLDTLDREAARLNISRSELLCDILKEWRETYRRAPQISPEEVAGQLKR